MKNLILRTDSYKHSHFNAYNPDVKYLYSYIESRGGLFDKTVFFGLQAFLKEYLSKPITQSDIEEAADFLAAHGEPFNRDGWEIILNEHNGYLPLQIDAVPEGMIIPTQNVLVTVVNTDPRLPWLTSFIETALLRAIWYPTTVSTLSWHIKQDIRAMLNKTCDDPEGQLAFRLHDFGARGSVCSESAGLAGMAHLCHFQGSDTIEGILAAKHYYGENMGGFSIPAAEHSVICSWGKDGEQKAFERLLDLFAGSGKLVAGVSDTYDLFNAVKNIWGGTLKERVINNGGTVVVRPDSGIPTIIPVQVVEMLADIFGYDVNSKGYKVLPNYVRVIQGDGVERSSIQTIMNNLKLKGFSIENVAFGMGGALHSHVNRDTQRFAMKASAINIDGIWHGISKSPATDPSKQSKAGRLALVKEPLGIYTRALEGHETKNILLPVWKNGKLLKDWKFSDIKINSNL